MIPANPDSRSSTRSYGLSSAPTSRANSRSKTNRISDLAPEPISAGYGHDFFTGNWSEMKDGDIPYDRKHEEDILSDDLCVEIEGNPNDIMYLENGETVDREYNPIEEEDSVGSWRSLKSIESISGLDMKSVAAISVPPKSLAYAASICIVLLTPDHVVSNLRVYILSLSCYYGCSL